MSDRVLLVGPTPPPTGGVATHLRDLRRALAELGVQVDLVDPRRRRPGGRDGRPRLLARLLLARARGDLVHVHTNGHNRGSWLLALACAGPRSILTLHSGLAPNYIRRHLLATRAIARRHAAVVCVNPEIAAALSLPSAHICPAFSPRSLDFRLPPPGWPAGLRARHQPLLACALAPGPEYGAPLLLDAFAGFQAQTPRAGLLIYGPGTRALAGEVTLRGLRHSVALLGELSREQALAVVAASDLFVRPTLADGDAVSVREALALGRAVVASAVGHRPDGVLLFPAGSATACAELLFRAASIGGALVPPRLDGLAALLGIYRGLGLRRLTVPVGTALAIHPQACAASPVE